MKLFIASIVTLLAVSAVDCTRHRDRKTSASPGAGLPRVTTAQEEQDGAEAVRRLESVSWSPIQHRLTWDISRGRQQKDENYRPVKTDHYEIQMDQATMTFNGETRRFSEDEATQVRAIMDVIAKYAADSTIWWEEGEGDPVDGSQPPARPRTRQKMRNTADPNQVVSLPGALMQLADIGAQRDRLSGSLTAVR